MLTLIDFFKNQNKKQNLDTCTVLHMHINYRSKSTVGTGTFRSSVLDLPNFLYADADPDPALQASLKMV